MIRRDPPPPDLPHPLPLLPCVLVGLRRNPWDDEESLDDATYARLRTLENRRAVVAMFRHDDLEWVALRSAEDARELTALCGEGIQHPGEYIDHHALTRDEYTELCLGAAPEGFMCEAEAVCNWVRFTPPRAS